ncbi:DUF4304 domain-containing protein [Hymenobacter sp. H14-R3]|uniref:DUF4304 domain-containing protein n=1 Tax=Hymenobacter sp. H14-R3 TaxID=3046308 RepID=UPI0024B98E05|nr:DUF4304 domain-containing protein [Hymenobacter sp. H14-R3]MDJ0365534.1 DUF4304 domain-containing protein [Hymenobacter sp. H14-R3]
MVKDILWPAFKKLGYKKSGNNFRYVDADGWGKIVQFEKASYNSATELSFVINVGLYLLDYDYYLCGETSGKRFTEPACVVRKRISTLTGNSPTGWFVLTSISDKYLLFSQLQTKFTQQIYPYLAAVKDKKAIYAILLAGHRADFPSVQIETLYRAGYQEAARELFSSEFAYSSTNKYYHATLLKLAARLGLPAALWTAEGPQ